MQAFIVQFNTREMSIMGGEFRDLGKCLQWYDHEYSVGLNGV